MAFQFQRGHGRGGRGGKPVANAEVMEEMRTLRAEVEAIRNVGRRDPEAGDVSEVEQEDNTEEEEEVTEENLGLKLLKGVMGASSKSIT